MSGQVSFSKRIEEMFPGKMLSGQVLSGHGHIKPEQMSPGQIAPVKDFPGTQTHNFGQYLVINSRVY